MLICNPAMHVQLRHMLHGRTKLMGHMFPIRMADTPSDFSTYGTVKLMSQMITRVYAKQLQVRAARPWCWSPVAMLSC